jgi:LPXTG-motif cell wall-anchored protein
VTFVVTDPRTCATTPRTVAVGATDSVVLTGFADGTVTIPVTANGKAANQTVTVHCDVPGVPSVTSGVTCADVQGVVTVNLANTGGNQPITFVVTDPRTSTSTTKIVAPGANTTVTLTGFADGVYTIPVTADGVSIAQTVTVKCHSPGVPSVVVAESCTNFDGDVTVTLGNTGGTDPIHFVVTDPRGGAPIVRDVAVGASTTVTLTGFTDGQWIIGITADGKAIAKTVTVACDRPGVPAVYHDVECGELGGKVVVTLKNTSPAGTAEPIVFEVTDPRDGSKTLVTLAAGDAGTVTLNQLADGDYTIPVSANGTALEPVTVTVDCQQPAVGGISTSCADGGEVVSLSNDGGSPVTLLVTKDGVKVKDVVVPAKGTNEVLVPFDNGQTAVIAVSDGPHVLLTETVTHSCVDPTTTTTTSTPSSTTTTPSGPSTTVAPGDTTPTVQVLGNEVTRAATTGTLPTTGSNTTGLVLFGLSLIAFGACMVQVSRKRG